MHVVASRGLDRATVGEIATEAGVAPGTFYNHFASLPEMIDVIADRLSGGVEIGEGALDLIEHDPAARVAVGTLQLLQMAENDSVAATAFVSLSAAKPDFRARVRAIVGRAISDGVESGRFDVDLSPAATNAVLGTVLQSMRSRILGETDASSAPEVAHLVLRILGMKTKTISVVVNQARQSLDATDAAERQQHKAAADGFAGVDGPE
jgi:AcrR family transcriptional regulator